MQGLSLPGGLTMHQMITLAKVSGAVYGATRPSDGSSESAGQIEQMNEMLAMLEEGERVMSMVRTDVLPMVVAVHNALVTDGASKKSLSEIESIGDMKQLVESLSSSAQAVVSGDTATKLAVATKIVSIVVSGVTGSKKLLIVNDLVSASEADIDEPYLFVKEARLVATAVDAFLGTDTAGSAVEAVADAVTAVEGLQDTGRDLVRGLCEAVAAAETRAEDCDEVISGLDGDQLDVSGFVDAARKLAALVQARVRTTVDTAAASEGGGSGSGVVSESVGNELMSVLFEMVPDAATRAALLEIAQTPEGSAVAESISIPEGAVEMISRIGSAFGVDTSALTAEDGTTTTAADVLPVVIAIGVETQPFVELLLASGVSGSDSS
eukprot:SAG31_NODE_6766_length_1894_cov_2.031755_2_plen_380_part_01